MYNGWKNYETWVTMLWLDNDQGTYNIVREMAESARAEAITCHQVKQEIWTVGEAEKFILADAIADFTEDFVYIEECGLRADLLNNTFHDIDFVGIAKSILSE